ncbi:MAG: OmpH family outer membrane protein [Proteobacteria bacterium]|nr:OmpH family outer membrane protein [Pseudomonadota bacterium]
MKILSKFIISIYCVLVFASQPYAEEIYKLGAVNAIHILEQSPQAIVARKLIEKEFSPRDKELLAKQKKTKALEDKFNKDSAIMSEGERAKLERDIIAKKRDLIRSQNEFKEDLNFRRNEEFARIQKRIVQAIVQVAKDNNYDVVLSEGVIYASSRVDISELVIEYLKKEINDVSE